MEKILTVEDVATILQVKPITVREMFREQRLRAFKMGKAWRTTESMLREDIATLARGETPPPQFVPEAATPTKAKAGNSAPKKPAPAKVEATEQEEQPAPPAKTAKAPAPPPAPVPSQSEPDADKADDTQQLLF